MNAVSPRPGTNVYAATRCATVFRRVLIRDDLDFGDRIDIQADALTTPTVVVIVQPVDGDVVRGRRRAGKRERTSLLGRPAKNDAAAFVRQFRG